MANQTNTFNSNFLTFHDNGPWEVNRIVRIEHDVEIIGKFSKYQDSTDAIMTILREALDGGLGVRPYGSTWSMNDIAHHPQIMIHNSSLNVLYTPDSADLTNNSYHPNDLLFAECGTTIMEINRYLMRRRRSLRTSGASNGQTIAGAISTGVHGSAIDVGSIQDSVVGLHIIRGPQDSVYIQRASDELVSQSFLNKLGAVASMADDDLFNAALVSMGAFGFIKGVMINVEKRFLLKRYVKEVAPDIALDLAESFDFENSSFFVDDQNSPGLKNTRPYHYKLYINPYRRADPFRCEIIFKARYRRDYKDPVPVIRNSIYRDLTSWLAEFADKHQNQIPRLVQLLKGQVFPALDHDCEGTLGEIFNRTLHRGKAFGCAMAIPNNKSREALNILYNVIDDHGAIPGIASMRFVPKSKAMLAFTKHHMNCILEIDGVWWNDQDLAAFMNSWRTKMDRSNIPYAFHWGKNADWKSMDLSSPQIFGDDINQWRAIRASFFNHDSANMDLFNNEFISRLSLDDHDITPAEGIS